jgi:hypothetical protein
VQPAPYLRFRRQSAARMPKKQPAAVSIQIRAVTMISDEVISFPGLKVESIYNLNQNGLP